MKLQAASRWMPAPEVPLEQFDSALLDDTDDDGPDSWLTLLAEESEPPTVRRPSQPPIARNPIAEAIAFSSEVRIRAVARCEVIRRRARR